MWQRTGDPLGSTAMPDEDRFFAMVDVGDCWEWTGFKELGYGRVGRNSRGGWAHRHAYEMLVGPIPSGMQIDHLCRNRGCVNPDHMEVVTLVENVMRGEGPSAKNARKTHCKRGHPFDEENTKVRANGSRRCLACVRIYDQRKKLPPEVTVRDL